MASRLVLGLASGSQDRLIGGGWLGQRDGTGQGLVRWAARHPVGRARGAVDFWPVWPGGLDQIVEWARNHTGAQQQAEPQPGALPPPRRMVEDHAAAERHEHELPPLERPMALHPSILLW